MPVVAIINQKGGVGKTTLTTNLASARADTGRVLLLDADPQPSALGWANLDPRPDPNPGVESADAGTLVRQVRAATGEYAWVVIDCPLEPVPEPVPHIVMQPALVLLDRQHVVSALVQNSLGGRPSDSPWRQWWQCTPSVPSFAATGEWR